MHSFDVVWDYLLSYDVCIYFPVMPRNIGSLWIINGDYLKPQERGSNTMEKQKRQESTK